MWWTPPQSRQGVPDRSRWQSDLLQVRKGTTWIFPRALPWASNPLLPVLPWGTPNVQCSNGGGKGNKKWDDEEGEELLVPAYLPTMDQAPGACENLAMHQSQRKFVCDYDLFGWRDGCSLSHVGSRWWLGFPKRCTLRLQVCDEIDRAQFTPLCKTFTRPRRTDEHGSVPTLRSDKSPEGWGGAQTERIVSRTAILILELLTRKRTFSVENPWTSFLWLLEVTQKSIKKVDVSLVQLHQCCYGAATPKPTGILTNASWMKTVCRLCWEQHKH